MAALKGSVGGFELVNSGNGSHRYEKTVGDTTYVVTIHDGVYACEWTVDTGAFHSGSGRKSEAAKSVERFGAPHHCASSWKDAKTKAYRFMRHFEGKPGYNGLLDMASRAYFKKEGDGGY